MGLYIRDEETCRLARELAALMGVTITEAVKVAVRERLERLQSSPKSGLPSQCDSVNMTAAIRQG
jgi:antitoxin VapB